MAVVSAIIHVGNKKNNCVGSATEVLVMGFLLLLDKRGLLKKRSNGMCFH